MWCSVLILLFYGVLVVFYMHCIRVCFRPLWWEHKIGSSGDIFINPCWLHSQQQQQTTNNKKQKTNKQLYQFHLCDFPIHSIYILFVRSNHIHCRKEAQELKENTEGSQKRRFTVGRHMYCIFLSVSLDWFWLDSTSCCPYCVWSDLIWSNLLFHWINFGWRAIE